MKKGHFYRILLATWILILILGMGSHAWAQAHADSLKRSLEQTSVPEERFDLLLSLAAQSIYIEPELSLGYANQALEVAKQLDDDGRYAIALNRIGAAYWSEGDLQKGLSFFRESRDRAQQVGDLELVARNIGNFGLIYSGLGNSEAAIGYYREALPFFVEIQNRERIAVTYNNLGKSYKEFGLYDSAKLYLEKAIELGRVSRPDMLPISLFNLGDTYYLEGKFAQAHQYIDSALQHAGSLNDRRGVLRANQLKAELSLLAGELGRAEAYARRAGGLADSSQSGELKYIAYLTLAKVLEAKAAYQEAHRYLKLHVQYKDSVQAVTTQQRLDFLDFQEKQTQISKLNEEKSMATAEASRRRMLNYSLITLLLLGGLLLWTLYQGRQRARQTVHLLQEKNEQIQQQSEEIKAQSTALEAHNQFKDKLLSIVSHDLRSPLRNLTELMVMIKEEALTLEEFREFLPQLTRQVQQNSDLLDNLLTWAEAQMDGAYVKPTDFDLVGLIEEKMQLFEATAERKSIQLVFAPTSPASLNIWADRDMIGIVLHNLLSNAIKFSPKATRVTVGLQLMGQEASLLVKDEGIGMSEAALRKVRSWEPHTSLGTAGEKGSGLGLILAQEFIAKNNGSFDLNSELEKGTVIQLSLPITNPSLQLVGDS